MAEDARLAEQVRYYRRRAAEYDQTAYGPAGEADGLLSDLVDGLQPTGRALEVACGTGAWTVHLVRWATDLTAIDTSPEMIELAKARVRDHKVRFVVADAFEFRSAQGFDTIFFAFWLSHVPTGRLEEFWSSMKQNLASHGRIIFVDEHRGTVSRELYAGDEVVERQLTDGSSYRLVKVLWEPAELEDELMRLGWRADVRAVSESWMAGEVRPVR